MDRGFTQILRIDYNETFSPVVHLKTIQALLALTVAEDWEIQQMNIKSIYLNGTLKEEIFMKQPNGFNDQILCLFHLLKTLYNSAEKGITNFI